MKKQHPMFPACLAMFRERLVLHEPEAVAFGYVFRVLGTEQKPSEGGLPKPIVRVITHKEWAHMRNDIRIAVYGVAL